MNMEPVKSTPSHPDWFNADREHLWHPYTQMATAPPPLAIERAEGAYLYTADGRAILDAISSWWVTLHGHSEPRIAAAIAEQARRLDHVIFAGCTHEPAARLAARLVQRAPAGLHRVFYSDNGSTAVEVALKMAFQHWANRGENDRQQFIALEAAYHGDTVGTMAVGGVDVFHSTFKPLLFDVLRVANPYVGNVDNGGNEGGGNESAETEYEERAGESVEHLERLLSENRGRVAAVIIEPMVQAAGGMLIWPASFLVAVRELCDRFDTLLIADEVFTGFARTGEFFACEHGPIIPDILCVSKAITGGTLPLAATLTHERIYDSFLSEDRLKTFFHGHSYTANPIACAASLASLDILEDEGLTRVRQIEKIHRERLERLRGLPAISGARCIGLIARMAVRGKARPGDETGYLDDVGPHLHREFLKRDLLLRPLGNILYLLPPLATSDADLARVYDAIEEVVGELG